VQTYGNFNLRRAVIMVITLSDKHDQTCNYSNGRLTAVAANKPP